jgi:hypothetical protein
MKITQKDINYFNNNHGLFDEPGFNENYNTANGIPSRAKWRIINRIHNDKFGMFHGKVTMKMIKDATQ